MVYTEGGARKLQHIGMPIERIRVINNTFDIEHESLLYAKYQAQPLDDLKNKLGLNSNSLFVLYIGRIYKEKRVEDFCNLIVRLNEISKSFTTIEGLILGDGPELPHLKKNYSNELLHYLGSVYDPEKVAQYMRVSTAVVMPGKVGLAVNHAFAHGLPVITRDSNLHAPEVEYIQHEVNGLILPEDFDEFVYSISNYLSSPEKIRLLSDNALRKSSDLNLDSMVSKFDSAVKSVIFSK
jgi:glycosyltransferase involved in cell wall biosynthesis